MSSTARGAYGALSAAAGASRGRKPRRARGGKGLGRPATCGDLDDSTLVLIGKRLTLDDLARCMAVDKRWRRVMAFPELYAHLSFQSVPHRLRVTP